MALLKLSLSEARKKYVDTKTAAQITGYTISTLNTWRTTRKNKPPFFKVKSFVFYDPEVLKDFVKGPKQLSLLDWLEEQKLLKN